MINRETIFMIILFIASIGCIYFAWVFAKNEKTLSYDNALHPFRFLGVFGISTLCGALLPFLSVNAWFYPVIALSLAITSNAMIGFIASSVLLVFSVSIAQCGIEVFLLYIICNIVTIIMFREIDKDLKVGLPIFVTSILLFTLTVCMDILFLTNQLTYDAILLPLINVFVNSILFLILLKIFANLIIYKDRNKYVILNDQECPLLVTLKETSKETYYHAIHTAYLCERIAKVLELDPALLKALGYYHRIGIIKGNNTLENILEIARENKLPVKLVELLEEYIAKEIPIQNKETTVLAIADTTISTITYLVKKDEKADLNYEQIIDVVMNKKKEKGSFDKSVITLNEWKSIRKILIEEKLYYDFLR